MVYRIMWTGYKEETAVSTGYSIADNVSIGYEIEDFVSTGYTHCPAISGSLVSELCSFCHPGVVQENPACG